MKLDRDAVYYLIEVAKGSGFRVVTVDTRETETGTPTVTLHLIQTKHPSEPAAPIFSVPASPIAGPIKLDKPDPFQTLDDI